MSTGQRKPYATPFAIFLIANVLFFTVQSLTHISVLGSTLDSHLHLQDWKDLAQALLDRRLQATTPASRPTRRCSTGPWSSTPRRWSS